MRALFGMILVFAHACSFSGASTSSTTDAGDEIVDANADSRVSDAPRAMQCDDWMPNATHFDPCMIPAPMPIDFSMAGTYTFNTDTPELLDPTGAPVTIAAVSITSVEEDPVLWSVDAFTLPANVTLRAQGDAPLIIASWAGMTIAGTIDVSSAINQTNGAGANSDACNEATAGTGGNSPAERSGGGGGGFAAMGGDGGSGNNGSTGGNGTGGMPVPPPAVVHGGCNGALGGGNNGGQGGGGRGSGGGAIQLTAFASILVTGTINANGSGGLTTGTTLKGGGGAGSGGFIGLDAQSVTLSTGSQLTANGGGGGEGNGDGGEENGNDGAVAEAAASGGDASADGGDGGSGGFKGSEVGDAGQNGAKGGGGGGGSAGYILSFGSDVTNDSMVVSPDLRTP